MDLNHQYSAHQKALLRAWAMPAGVARNEQLRTAQAIASGIGEHQSKLGAAASCAWSIAGLRAATALRAA